jgi:hypothetical protein
MDQDSPKNVYFRYSLYMCYVLGYLERADTFDQHKRSILVCLRQGPDKKWVVVRPVWQARAAGRCILFVLVFLIVSNLNANENMGELK